MGIQERKEREKQMRKELILDAAEKLFFTHGSENVSMDSLAKAAELSKGTLYLYFRSKEEIHYNVTQRGLERLDEKMKNAVNPENKAIENILVMADTFVRFFDEDDALAASIIFFQACEIEKLNIDPEVVKQDFFENTPIRMLTEYVAQGVKEGAIRNDIPVEIISNTLWSQLMGVVQVAKNKKEIFDIIGINRDILLDSHFKIVLNGLKT